MLVGLPWVGDKPEVRLVGLADQRRDELQLVDVVVARKERLTPEHLSEYAAHTPHVDRLVVVLDREHDLRRAIPPGDDVPDRQRNNGTRA